MKVLCVHQNFPGQYLHLARYLGTQSQHQIVFVTQRQDVELPGVRKIVYKPRRTISPQVHHYLRESEAAVLNAQEVARIALDLRKAGFIPDVMLGHNGWGEIWYLKDIFPEAPLIGYGLFVDFFSPEQIADRVIEALEDRKSFASLRQNARQTIVDRFDLKSICLPAHLRMLNMLVTRDSRATLSSIGAQKTA